MDETPLARARNVAISWRATASKGQHRGPAKSHPIVTPASAMTLMFVATGDIHKAVTRNG